LVDRPADAEEGMNKLYVSYFWSHR